MTAVLKFPTPAPRKEYISAVEAAKMIRAELKKKFPGVKFSVRSQSYAGGSSVNVSYTDGPAYKRVVAIVEAYEGASFDGMIDMEYSIDRWLCPLHGVSFASTSGTEGSRGVVEAANFGRCCDRAAVACFLCKYNGVSRELSEAFYRKATEKLSAEWGKPLLLRWPCKVGESVKITDATGSEVPEGNFDYYHRTYLELARKAMNERNGPRTTYAPGIRA